MSIAQWPETVKGDGSTYILKTSLKEYTKVNLQSDVATANKFKVIAKEKVQNDYKPLSFTATLTRKGYTDFEEGLTKYTVSAAASKNGEAIFENVKKGFYKLHISYNGVYNYPDEDEDVFVDEGDYVFIKEDANTIDYFIECIPLTKNNASFSNKRNILGAGGTWSGISVVVTVDGHTVPSSMVKVNTDYNDNGTAAISFHYGVASESLVITQSVTCFDKNDNFSCGSIKYNDYKNTTFKNKFNIHRCEDLSTSNIDHTKDEWTWSSNSSQHWQNCNRCGWERRRTDHYINQQTDGQVLKGQERFRSTHALLRGNDNSSDGAGHEHDCTVCGYTKHESCSNGALTFKYDTVNGSGSWHYRFCKYCTQRCAAGEHHMSEKITQTASCTQNGNKYHWCTDNCGYNYNQTITGGHNYVADGEEYQFGWMNFCYLTNARKKCSNCGDVVSTQVASHSHTLYKEFSGLENAGQIFTDHTGLTTESQNYQVAKLYAKGYVTKGEIASAYREVVPDKNRYTSGYSKIISCKGRDNKTCFGGSSSNYV